MKFSLSARIRRSSLLAAGCALVTGCSALVDSARYVGDGGAVDGTTDTGIPANAPTTPEIAIDPVAPTTADDIRVTITAESTDPEAGSVTYEYRWLRDGAAVPERTTSTLPADATAKDETWTVEVTPIAEPGTRRGAPATADVIIGNTPPVLTTVALDGYMTAVGETMRGTPGPVVDADGDTSSLRYRWHLDDVPIEGMTSSTLATTTLTPGARVQLEAWANDGTEDGPSVTVGPIVLVADQTRWRPLAPDTLDGELAHLVYDAPHRRHVRFDGTRLWEHWMSGTTLHTTPIPLQGDAPTLEGQQFVSYHDPVGRRLFVRDVADPAGLYALDLSRRGAETWSRIMPAGTAPPQRFGEATFHDATSNVLWIYGGFNEREPEAVGAELWSLSFELGSERWERHELSGATIPPSFGAAMAADPTSPGAMLLFGGATLGAGGAELLTRIYRLVLGEDAVAVEELAAVLPRAGSGIRALAVGEKVLLAGGTNDFDDASVGFGITLFDPATGTFTESPSTVPAGMFGTLDIDPDDPTRALWTRGTVEASRPGNGEGFELRAIAVADAALTDVALELRPPAISDGAVGGRQEMIVLSGVTGAGPVDVVWQLDLPTNQWTVSTPLPDAVTNTSPAPRYGVMASAASPWARPQLFAGVGESGTFVDTEVWELIEGRWLLRSLAVGASLPPVSRRGAAFLGGGGCGADQNYFFGGESPAGVLLGDSGKLVCAEGERLRNCTWEAPVATVGTSGPTPRAYATMGTSPDNYVWMVGGRTVSGATNEVFSFSSCSGAPAWNTVRPEGPALPARYAHSMALVEGSGAALSSFLVFGGLSAAPGENTTLDDTWRLEVTSGTTGRWVTVTPVGELPPPRAYHQAMWDGNRSRLVVFGGRTPDERVGDLWELLVRP